MFSILTREFGVRYNTDKIPEDVPLDMDDAFIHGILQGNGGTCGSLPVLYAAVGRRLGYPLKLVQARTDKWGHCFVRWDDPDGERFNIEANNCSFDCPADDYYRKGLFVHRPDWERFGSVMKSNNPRDELAYFLSQRACCWQDSGDFRQQVDTLAWAVALAPNNAIHLNFLKQSLNGWKAKLDALLPEQPPELILGVLPKRLYPTTLPWDFELDIQRKSVTEFLLSSPVMNEQWWEPLRRGMRSDSIPHRLIVRINPDGYDVKAQYVD